MHVSIKKATIGLDTVIETVKPLSVAAFKQAEADGAWILDTRAATTFTQGFVPNSLNIGLDGRYAEFAGTLIPNAQALILVTDAGKEKESITRLARVGIDNIHGYLEGGYEGWQSAGEQIDLIIDIEPDELAMDIPHDNMMEIIDVRKPTEFETAHVKGAVNMPLDTLMAPLTVAMIDDKSNLYIHCAGGYRSVMAASILKREGYHNLRNVLGGMAKMKLEKGIPMVLPGKVEILINV